MWKKIRYALYFAVLIFVFSITFYYREYYYIPFIQKALDKATDAKLKFRNFYFEFPFNLVIRDIQYDNKIFADKTTLRFEPFIFFKDIKKPLKSLVALDINKVVFFCGSAADGGQTVFSENQKQKLYFKKEEINSYKKFFDLFNLNCDIDKLDIIYDDKIIKADNINIALNKEIDIGARINYLNYDIKTKGNLKLEEEFLTGDFHTETDGFIKSNFDFISVYNFSDNSLECNIDTKELLFNRLIFENIKTNVKKSADDITVVSRGKDVNMFLKTDNSFNVWSSTGTVNIRDVSDVINTKLKYSAKVNDKIIDYLKINAKNVTVFTNNFGDLDFEVNNDNQVYNILCYHNSGNRFKTVLKKNGSYNTEVYNKKTKIGDVKGNYKKGSVSVDIKNIPITKIPFMDSLKNVKGTVSLYGNIGAKMGTIFIKANKVASKRLKGFDVLGRLYKRNYKWFLDIATRDKKIAVDGFYENKKNNGMNVSYNGVDSNNLLKILGIKNPQLSGKLDGTIKYSSQGYITNINTKLKNGALFGNKFKSWDISSSVSKTQLNISTFTFNGTKAKINVKSSIDFSKEEGSSYFNCDIKNFKINDINLNYNLNFTGQYSGNGEITGNFNVDKFSLNEFTFPHTASIILSLNKMVIKNFNDDNGLEGEFAYDYASKKVSALLKNTKSKLSHYYPHIKGRLTSELKAEGNLNNPEISFNGNIKNALYNNVLFDSKFKTEYKDKKLYLKNLQLTSGKKAETKITASGTVTDKNTSIKINFKGVSEDIINRYVGFRTPFTADFYGSGTLTGPVSNLKAVLNLYADTIFVKSLKFNSFSSKVKAYKKNISIDSAKIKISDSEIKILSANFNTNTGKYNSEFKFVNSHLGPFDVFGNMKIDGKMTKRLNGSKYDGSINLSDLWLNDEKIDSLSLKYFIENRNFSFNTNKQEPLKISGSVNFNQYPKIILRNILINRSGRFFNLNGSVMSDEVNLNVNGKNIDLATLSGLLNLPIDSSGDLNFSLKTSGSISGPTINLKMNSANGYIYHVPFDLFNISADVKNNNLNINDFRITKIGKYELLVDGYFPFWLDSSITEQMMKKPVNVNYKLNDNSLYILNNISENSITSKKGNLKIEGNLSGLRKNISNVGKLSLTGKNIKTNSYINKIKDLNADIVWNKNLFKIQKAYAKAGSGVVEATGTVKMQGINPSFYNLNLFTTKKGVPVVIKELPIPTSGVFKMESGSFANFSKGVPTFNFKLYGNAKNPRLTGWANLENTTFCFPSPVKSEYKELPYFIDDLLDKLYVNINLKTANNTRYENSYIGMLLNGSINLKGKIDDILANGVVVSNSGLFSYLGNDFEIINSKMELINNDLFVTLEGESEVYTTGESAAEVIKIYIDRSDINNLKTRFASKNDPTMDSKKALAKLTKTDPTASSSLDTSTDFLAKQQAIRMFSSNVATPLANTVLKKTGIVDNVRLGFVNQDTLQVSSDEEASMAELLYGMKYSVEKNINRLIQIGYSITFDKIEKEIDLKQAVEMSFKVNRNLFLKGSYGLQSDNPEYEPEKKLMIEQRLRF